MCSHDSSIRLCMLPFYGEKFNRPPKKLWKVHTAPHRLPRNHVSASVSQNETGA